jgi:quinol-cytochrome oxidoreductase complex cytochrome b subunit
LPPEDKSYDRKGLIGRVKHSILTEPVYTPTARGRRRSVFDYLVVHIHPRTVPAGTLRLSLTWGLGGMAVVLFGLLVLTGILLLFVYEPTPEGAYDSVVALKKDVSYGQFIRNIHYWSGNILLVVSLLHLLRVYLTAAYHRPRQLNWVIGLILHFLVLFSNLTGYLLPWDQVAFWAITICTSMLGYFPLIGSWLQGVIRGGPEVGAPTLSLFYALHIAVLPILMLVAMPFHFWRVRQAGGVVIPRKERASEPVPTIPNLVVRELAAALVLTAFVLLCAVAFDATLEDPANPGFSPNPAKAPWYFLGLQELLLHFHPLFAVLIIPALVTIGLALVPYLRYGETFAGVWFCSKRGRRMAAVSAVAALLVTPLAIICDEFLFNFAGWMGGVPLVVSSGVIPAVLLFGIIAGFYILIKKRYRPARAETMQAVFIFLFVGFLILTGTGIWFRGEGMALVWPWSQ